MFELPRDDERQALSTGLGVLLNAAILEALTFAAAANERLPYIYPAAVGLTVGALLVLLPQSVTGGEAMIPGWVREQPGILALLALSAVRFCTSVASYSTGVPGGIFAPILSLAACVGLTFSGVVSMLVPDGGVDPGAFAIAAMGGLFTASVRAPMVGVVLTLELTGAYDVTLPLVATCLLPASPHNGWVAGRYMLSCSTAHWPGVASSNEGVRLTTGDARLTKVRIRPRQHPQPFQLGTSPRR